MELKKLKCNKIQYEGNCAFIGKMPDPLKRKWNLRREKVGYDIEAITIFDHKKVIISMSEEVDLHTVFVLLCNILRFDCLFDGRFFKLETLLVDDEDMTESMETMMLSYYGGVAYYTAIKQPMSDFYYKRGFCAWEKFDRKHRDINQMFYYIAFVTGITSDLRLALFCEIFEPLSKMLAQEGKITLLNSNPVTTRKATCPNCKTVFYDQKSNRKVSLADKISSVLNVYGNLFFARDDMQEVIMRTVRTRNKMLHVNEKGEKLSGRQCGFYEKKYVGIYRLIIMKECNLLNADVWNEFDIASKKYDKEFNNIRIKKKRHK